MDLKLFFCVLLVFGLLIFLFQHQYVARIPFAKDKTFSYKNSIQNYSVVGKGNPLILLHGSMISHPWGKEFEERLGKQYRVFIPDLPGFGGSDVISGEIHNTKLFAEALCAFIKETQNENSPVIAFSLGTVVAVRSANTGCLKGSMILIGTPGKVESEMLKQATKIPIFIRRILGSTKFGREKIMIPVLWDILGIKGDVRTSTLPKKLLSTDVRSLVDLNVYTEIEQDIPKLIFQLKNKTTFVYGENDGVINTTSEFIKSPIIIKGADHNVFLSKPDEILQIIQEKM